MPIESSDMDLLWENTTFWAALCGWVVAQLTKMICFFAQTHRIEPGYLISTGGMPSAHSAMATALATSVGLRTGLGDPLFAISLAFAIVVMFDAQSVRRAAGNQARIINQMIDELFKHHRFADEKLAELLGHTRLEVFMGMVMGVLCALLTHGLMG